MDEFARATAKPNQGDAVTSTGDTITQASQEARLEALAMKQVGGTEYVVLEAQPNGSWQLVERVTGTTSANAAIQKAMDNYADTGGTFVAIPSRSWKPVKVTVTSKPVITLEDA